MHKLNKYAYVHFEMLLLDVLGLIISFMISYKVACLFTYMFPVEEYIWILLVYIPFFLFAMSMFQMYHKLTFYYYDRIIRHVLFSSAVAGMFLAALMYYSKYFQYSRLFNLVIILITFLIISIIRIGYFYYSRKMNNAALTSKQVLVVGIEDVIKKYEYFLNKTHMTINVLGYIHLTNYSNQELIKQLEDFLKRQIVDEVVFAVPSEYIPNLEDSVALCENMGITIRIVLNTYNLNISKMHISELGTLPMLTLHSVSLNDFALFVKRLIDIFAAVIGLAITALLSIIIIPLIKLNSPGPVLFAQERVGTNGRIFKMYKFRSMYLNAEEEKKKLLNHNKVTDGLMFKIINDPRVTPIGRFLRKTSLDELPQFINILKGDMSLVGTRPPTIDEVKKYKTHHYRRISIKPGLTGMWQVQGRSEINNFDKVVELDTAYIDKWSIWLDFKIIIKTILVVLNNKGAY